MKHCAALGPVLLALAIVGCGETNIQAIHRLTPQFKSKRQQLWQVASKLPPAGTVREPWRAGTMNPPLRYDERGRQFNTDIWMAAQLVNPELALDDEGQFDALLARSLHTCVLWMGPENPLDQSVHDDRGDLGKLCETAYAFPYLGVLQVVRFELPEVLDLEVFVVDLRSQQLLAAAPITIRSTYSKADLGRGPWAAEARQEVYTAFFVEARCQVMALLAGLPGAQVSLEHDCPDEPMFRAPAATVAR